MPFVQEPTEYAFDAQTPIFPSPLSAVPLPRETTLRTQEVPMNRLGV